jgi:hypothetical protein
MHLVRLVWRLVVLTFALGVEVIVVTTAWVWGVGHFAMRTTELIDRMPPADVAHLGAYAMAAGTAALAAAFHAFAPWVVAVAATEILRWRGILVHLGAGAIVALAAAVPSGAVMFPAVVQLLVALGLVGGFVHWLIAGRNAGRWSEGILTPAPDVPEAAPTRLGPTERPAAGSEGGAGGNAGGGSGAGSPGGRDA